MNQKLIRKVLQIEGMTCSNCEVIIENALSKVDGIIEIKAKYKSSTVYITYDDNLISLNQIIDHIENIGYEVPKFYVVLRKPLKIDIFAEPTKNSSSYSYILTLFTPLPQHI